jgi:hypothetical protein
MLFLMLRRVCERFEGDVVGLLIPAFRILHSFSMVFVFLFLGYCQRYTPTNLRRSKASGLLDDTQNYAFLIQNADTEDTS